MTKKKLAIVVALTAVVVLVALLAFAVSTDACITRIATGPMAKGQMTTTFDVYAYHISNDNCDCNHAAGTLTLFWKYSNEQIWRTAGEMNALIAQWCGVQEYEYTGFEVTSGTIIDLKVVCDEHEDCQRTRLGFSIP